MKAQTVTLRFSQAENGLTLEECLAMLLSHLPFTAEEEDAVCSKTTD